MDDAVLYLYHRWILGVRVYENLGLVVTTITVEQEEAESSDLSLKTVSEFLPACFFFSVTNTHMVPVFVYAENGKEERIS